MTTGLRAGAGLLIALLAGAGAARADVISGGGVRGGSGVVLVDRLGAPFGGRGSAEEPLTTLEVGLPSLAATPTPVAWVTVSVLWEPTPAGGRVRLAWSVTGDSDPVGFVVERGLDEAGPYAVVGPPRLDAAAREFLDEAPPADGVAWYRLVAIDRAGDRFVAGPFAVRPESAPPATTLRAPAPNPSAGAVAIDLTLAAPEVVRLDVFDVQGRLVERPIDGPFAAGWHRLQWNAGAAATPSGVYFVRVAVGTRVDTFKVVLRR